MSAGSRPLGEAVDVTVNAPAGLAAAQPTAIIHRDVKPTAFFLSGNGSTLPRL